MTTPYSRSARLHPSWHRWLLFMVRATHIKQQAHCVTVCSCPFTSPSLIPPSTSSLFFFHPWPSCSTTFPFVALTSHFSLSSHLSFFSFSFTFPLPPYSPPLWPCSVALCPPHLPPLHSSPLPLSPSFHFGFSDSGNEMFHYLHFTAFNRERI